MPVQISPNLLGCASSIHKRHLPPLPLGPSSPVGAQRVAGFLKKAFLTLDFTVRTVTDFSHDPSWNGLGIPLLVGISSGYLTQESASRLAL